MDERDVIAYDENENIISKTEFIGKIITSIHINENNQPETIISGNGAVVHYEYNEQGQVTKETVKGLGETSYQYSGGCLPRPPM